MPRSLVEYGHKHKPKRKRCKKYQLASTVFINSIHTNRSFLNNLFLFQQNKNKKVNISIRKYNRKRKPKTTNTNSVKKNSIIEIKENSSDKIPTFNNYLNFQKNIFAQSTEDLSCKFSTCLYVKNS